MKPDIFVIIGMFLNIVMIVLYPAQILGEDSILLGIMNNDDTNYFTVNGTGLISGYDAITGEPIYNTNYLSSVAGAATSTEGDAGVFQTDLGIFVDWVKAAFNIIKEILLFMVGFLLILWGLPNPLNFLVAAPITLIYTYSLAQLLMGRY